MLGLKPPHIALADHIAAQPTAAQAIQLGAKYGPNSALAFQRSQYLADAIQAMEQSAAQNIRTPTALWSNLLADGIMQWGKNRADRAALDAYSKDQQALLANLVHGLPGEAGAVAPPSAAPPPMSEIPPQGPPPPVFSEKPSAPADNAVGTALSSLSDPASRDLMARMMIGEAGGEGDQGMMAVGHVALNRLAKGYGGAKSLVDVLKAPHQFAGLSSPNAQVSPDNPAYQHALSLVDSLQGTPDSTNGAINFENPALHSAANPMPAWATGPSTTIGHHQFFGGQGGPPTLAAAAPSQPTAQAGPNGSPVQLAMNGPLQPGMIPSAPAAAMGTPQAGSSGQPLPPQLAGDGQAAQGATAGSVGAPISPQASYGPQPVVSGQSGPPRQLVTPEEVALAKRLYADPRTRDEGEAMLIKLQQRMASPIEAPKNMMWDPKTGRAVPIPGTTYTQLPGASPSDAAEADPFGHVTHSKIEGVQGPLPEGTAYVNGQIVRIQGGGPRPLTDPQERARWGISPQDRNAYAVGADGKIIKTGEDPFPAERQMAYTAQVTGMEPYKNYVLGRGYLTSMQELMKQPGGFADLGLIENAGKTINPTIAIRPNMIEQYGKEVGWPDWLRGEISSVVNHGGHLTAEGRNALLNIAQANLQAHWDQLQPILKKVDHDATRYGITREDLLPDLVPMPAKPPAPYPGASIPGAGPPGQMSRDQVLAQARAAIAQGRDRAGVIAKVRAMGIDPSGL